MGVCVALLPLLLVLAAPPTPSTSVGAPWRGKLHDGVAMPLKGKHHRFTGVVERKKSNYGTAAMVALLSRAARTVGTWVEGPPMVLGSISRHCGGKMKPHKSHQSGRDVDILFYVINKRGERRRARGFYAFDGRGACRSRHCSGWRFDVQRNWWLVRTLLWSKRPKVQFIFVSTPLRRHMLAYARKRGELPEILRRARKVLIQPGNSSPHADHFHVRIYCSPNEKKRGCLDRAPIWDWVR